MSDILKTREEELKAIRIEEHVAAATMARAILDARVDGTSRDGDTVSVDARAWREILIAFRQYRHARWEWEDFMDRGGGINGKPVKHVREYDGRRELTPMKHPWSR